MINLASFDSAEDAYLFRAFLNSRGLEASILDEHFSQLFWHYRQACGGIRVVQDDEEDLSDAVEAQREYFAAINTEPRLQIHAPFWPAMLLLSWAIGVPLFFGRKFIKETKADF